MVLKKASGEKCDSTKALFCAGHECQAYTTLFLLALNKMSKKYNPSDADDAPPPAYQEVVDPPFNPNFSPSSSSQPSAPQPPHTPDINHNQQSQSLYPQIPSSPVTFPQPQHYQPQQQQIVRQQQGGYQAIEIPYNANSDLLRERRRRHALERRKFPLAAIFFLFGW